jgi:GNAT superfamily N-acetyltransferase
MTDTGQPAPVLTVTEDPEERDTWLELHHGDARIGYAHVTEYGAGYWVYDIEVERDRGQGHGARLLAAVIERFGDEEIALSCDPGPPRPGYPDCAQLAAWYGRHGFQPSGDPDDPRRMTRPSASW